MSLKNLSDELYHSGKIGMKWGVRRGPPYPIGSKKKSKAKKNLKNAKMANVKDWGSSADKNILYVTGFSGSGKSTVAKSFANSQTDIVHLDLYYEGEPGQESEGLQEHRCAELDKFLASKNVRSPNEVPRREWKKERTLDKFEDAVQEFGRKQFSKKRKVIVEGVELADDSFKPDKKFFKDKPLVVLTTSAITSMRRAFARDGRGGLLKGLMNLDDAWGALRWYSVMNQQLNDLTSIAEAKRGRKFVEDILSKREG